MNATIANTTAAFARKEFEKSKALKARWDAEIAAGRYLLEGPSFVGTVGDGVSEQVPSDSSLRAEYRASQNYLGELLDTLTAQNTGFHSFVDLVEAQRKHGYRPSFYEKGNEAVAVLADAYDYVAGLWGLPEKSYRPEKEASFHCHDIGDGKTQKTYHLLKDFGVYKSTLVKNFEDNDRGPEHNEARRLLARRTQRYTLAELEVLFGFLWTAHDDCVTETADDEFSAIEVYTSTQKIARGEAALARLEALKAAQS